MPNPYFRFKQFTIHQNRCAMKVCTDSCILGAWTAIHTSKTKNILDIGTGSGLLPMMLAQKSGACIDGIESDTEAAEQAAENIMNSAWANRVRVLKGDVREYALLPVYDFIISNPPFYESDLRSPELKKNQAKHDESLTLEELIHVIRSYLQPEGSFSVLLSFHRTVYFENLAASNGFFVQKKLTIRQSPKHTPFRTICLFSRKKPKDFFTEELLIKDQSGNYSPQFENLLGEFYERRHFIR